jgi:hypothetical protein
MAQTQYRKPDRAPRALRTTITATLTIMLALVLALGFAIAPGPTQAFADVPQSTGTEDSPAKAAITKNFQMSEGTAVPNVNFVFDIKAVSVDGVAATDPDAPTNMPAIDDVKIPFSSTNMGTVSTANGIKTLKKQSDDFLDGVTFTKAGIYVYEIREIAIEPTGYPLIPVSSSSSYEVTVFVKQGTVDTTKFYPAIVTAERIYSNDGTPAGVKVDPTPGNGTITFSKMDFLNGYGTGTWEPGDPKTSTNIIALSKTVTGEYASKDAYFDFSLTVTKPSFLTSTVPVTYKAYVLDTKNSDAVVTSAANLPADSPLTIDTDTYGTYIEIASGVTAQVRLKDGQKLVVTGIPAGTSFSATEAGVANYVPSVVTTIGDSVVGTGSASAGASLSTGVPTPWYARATAPDAGLQAKTSLMAFTNTSDGTSPTGLDTGDIPFVALVLICAGGLAAYFAVALRRRAKRRS